MLLDKVRVLICGRRGQLGGREIRLWLGRTPTINFLRNVLTRGLE